MNTDQIDLLNQYVFAEGDSDKFLATLRAAKIDSLELQKGIEERVIWEFLISISGST